MSDGTINSDPGGEGNADAPRRARYERFRLIRKLLRIEVYYLLALSGFALLTSFAYFNAYFGWDLRVARALQSIPGLLGFMRVVSWAGDGWTPFVLNGVTVATFLLFKKRSEALAILFSAGGSAIVARLIKTSVSRPRPTADLVSVITEGDQLSFPSGHVTFYVTYFGFLFLLSFANLRRGSTARMVALVLTALPVILIGFSRVYLGRHWPSDTLGAYMMGGIWVALSLDLYRRLKG